MRSRHPEAALESSSGISEGPPPCIQTGTIAGGACQGALKEDIQVSGLEDIQGSVTSHHRDALASDQTPDHDRDHDPEVWKG